MTTKKNLETIDSLQSQLEETKAKMREMKRGESEINLQISVGKMNSEEENISEILRCCYSYIANHRMLVKGRKPKDNFKKLE